MECLTLKRGVDIAFLVAVTVYLNGNCFEESTSVRDWEVGISTCPILSETESEMSGGHLPPSTVIADIYIMHVANLRFSMSLGKLDYIYIVQYISKLENTNVSMRTIV